MDTPFLPEIVIKNLGPEVKSFIYQIILEFEPFSTPDTVVSVVAKNPLGLLKNVSVEDAEAQGIPEKTELKKMYRIEISISESGSTISAEGLHEDIYLAIKAARDALLKTLSEIQDDVVSSQDRNAQIRQVLAAGGTVH